MRRPLAATETASAEVCQTLESKVQSATKPQRPSLADDEHYNGVVQDGHVVRQDHVCVHGVTSALCQRYLRSKLKTNRF